MELKETIESLEQQMVALQSQIVERMIKYWFRVDSNGD